MRLPICYTCKHYCENSLNAKECCDAFPDGIPPERVKWKNGNAECANGIKYEDENGEEYKEFVPKPGSVLSKMLHRL